MNRLPELAVFQMQQYCIDLQQRICDSLIAEETAKIDFKETVWTHPEGGGGKTCCLMDGKVIEKAAVNYSHIYGSTLPSAAIECRYPTLLNQPFQAIGLSTIVHPYNPYIPTSHMNVRLIIVDFNQKSLPNPIWWFGGGFDLTPYYGFEEDCEDWHQTARLVCEKLDRNRYDRYKQWCDQYFYLPHRNEPRGIGGIFFDDLNELDFAQCFDFIRCVGNDYLIAYKRIVQKRKNYAFGERERHFQSCRRGRYVEFNLLYDRGTLFGLQSKGRTESILLSLPPTVAWNGDDFSTFGPHERELYEKFLKVPCPSYC